MLALKTQSGLCKISQCQSNEHNAEEQRALYQTTLCYFSQNRKKEWKKLCFELCQRNSRALPPGLASALQTGMERLLPSGSAQPAPELAPGSRLGSRGPVKQGTPQELIAATGCQIPLSCVCEMAQLKDPSHNSALKKKTKHVHFLQNRPNFKTVSVLCVWFRQTPGTAQGLQHQVLKCRL